MSYPGCVISSSSSVEIKKLDIIPKTVLSDPQFSVLFLVAGNVLLLATLAAVVLTLDTGTKDSLKTQVIFKQLSRTYKNVLVV